MTEIEKLEERVRLHLNALRKNEQEGNETPNCIKQDAEKTCDELNRASGRDG